MQAIILAGGKGTRLKPFTIVLPKPLMPIGDLPILEIIIRQLKRDGFSDLIVSLGYLEEIFRAFLNDGKKFGVNIVYSTEKKPLGTAGPLTLIDSLNENFLVINGDTLTTLNYKKLFEFHCKNRAMATISTYTREVKIDFGVIKTDKDKMLKEYIEKPVYSFQVSMGVNVFNRKILKYARKNQYLDLPDLLLKLIGAGEKVIAYPFRGFWLDIGRVDDYEKANLIFNREKAAILKNCL